MKSFTKIDGNQQCKQKKKLKFNVKLLKFLKKIILIWEAEQVATLKYFKIHIFTVYLLHFLKKSCSVSLFCIKFFKQVATPITYKKKTSSYYIF